VCLLYLLTLNDVQNLLNFLQAIQKIEETHEKKQLSQCTMSIADCVYSVLDDQQNLFPLLELVRSDAFGETTLLFLF
jgi:hypothetical protein